MNFITLIIMKVIFFFLNDLAFDADGYGLYFNNKAHAQTVEGHTPFSLQFEFSKHLHSFLLNGLTSVSLHGQVLNIMNVSGKMSMDWHI